MLDACRRSQMLHLWIGEHLIDAVDRSAWHTGFIEDRDPFGARLLPERRVQHRVECAAVLGTLELAFELCALQQLRTSHCSTEPGPHPAARSRHVDISV